jgi:hypothetical protein
MNEIKNTLLLINGNIDSTDDYSATQVGDQSGNFLIDVNEHFTYSADTFFGSPFHKSLKFSESTEVSMNDATHRFNFSDREFSIDAWVKFDENELLNKKKHVIISKWEDTGSVQDEKVFRFYYEHSPIIRDEDDVIEIQVAVGETSLMFNNQVMEEFTLEVGKKYVFNFNPTMYADFLILHPDYVSSGYSTPSITPETPTITATSTDFEEDFMGMPPNFYMKVGVHEGLWAEQLLGDLAVTETETGEIEWVYATSTETEPEPEIYSEPTMTETAFYGEDSEDGGKFSSLTFNGAVVNEIPMGLEVDLTDYDSIGFEDGFVGIEMAFYRPTAIHTTPPNFAEVSLDPGEDPQEAYMDYLEEQIPPSSTDTTDEESILDFSTWYDETYSSPVSTPTSTQDDVEIVDRGYFGNLKIVNPSVIPTVTSKLVFEYNGIKGYDTEHRTLFFDKDFTYATEGYPSTLTSTLEPTPTPTVTSYPDANVGIHFAGTETLEQVKFGDLDYGDQDQHFTDTMKNLFNFASKMWLSEDGIVFYRGFRDFETFYTTPDVIPEPAPTSTETSQPAETFQTSTPTETEDGNPYEQFETYLNSEVDRRFWFVPTTSYDSDTGEISFLLNMDGEIECLDVTKHICSGVRREMDVTNLIDGNWHHVYFGIEALLSDEDGDENVMMGVDGRMITKSVTWSEDESLPYLLYDKPPRPIWQRGMKPKMTKLTSIQPYFETAGRSKISYAERLTPTSVGIGHDADIQGNNGFVGLIDSIRINDYITFQTESELSEYYNNPTPFDCKMYVDGINNYSIYDENTQYEFHRGKSIIFAHTTEVVRYVENPTTPYEAFKHELGSEAYMKRILGFDLDSMESLEREEFIKNWRWSLKFIMPPIELNKDDVMIREFKHYADNVLDGGEIR